MLKAFDKICFFYKSIIIFTFKNFTTGKIHQCINQASFKSLLPLKKKKNPLRSYPEFKTYKGSKMLFLLKQHKGYFNMLMSFCFPSKLGQKQVFQLALIGRNSNEFQ